MTKVRGEQRAETEETRKSGEKEVEKEERT